MAGRPKKPSNVKSLHGTDQPCRRDTGEPWLDFDALDALPEAPDFLPIDARQYWDRIVPLLIEAKVLTRGDLESLEVMCLLYGEIKKMAKAGMSPPASTATQLRLYQTEFGLTPASRRRVSGSATDKPGGNKFGGNGRRKKTP